MLDSKFLCKKCQAHQAVNHKQKDPCPYKACLCERCDAIEAKRQRQVLATRRSRGLSTRVPQTDPITKPTIDIPFSSAQCNDLNDLLTKCADVPSTSAQCNDRDDLAAKCADVPSTSAQCNDRDDLAAKRARGVIMEDVRKTPFHKLGSFADITRVRGIQTARLKKLRHSLAVHDPVTYYWKSCFNSS